ncbi:MAG: hypothetical protein ACK2UO_11150 [Caldilineaceae bacterium]
MTRHEATNQMSRHIGQYGKLMWRLARAGCSEEREISPNDWVVPIDVAGSEDRVLHHMLETDSRHCTTINGTGEYATRIS